jgi:hypothetical protein
VVALVDLELWDGRHVWCSGYREGLPWWGWGWAPTGLATKSQLHGRKLRLRPRQDPYGLIVWKRGRRTAELYRVDQALPSRRMSTRWLAAIAAMQRAHRTCRRCGTDTGRWLPTSTWKCPDCCAITGDYGQPGHRAVA